MGNHSIYKIKYGKELSIVVPPYDYGVQEVGSRDFGFQIQPGLLEISIPQNQLLLIKQKQGASNTIKQRSWRGLTVCLSSKGKVEVYG